jgi:hypothetical protein
LTPDNLITLPVGKDLDVVIDCAIENSHDIALASQCGVFSDLIIADFGSKANFSVY